MILQISRVHTLQSPSTTQTTLWQTKLVFQDYFWHNFFITAAHDASVYFISMLGSDILTPWLPLGFSDFRKKNSSFRLPYQRPSSSADCAKELFNS